MLTQQVRRDAVKWTTAAYNKDYNKGKVATVAATIAGSTDNIT